MQILLIRHSHAVEREDWNDLGNMDNLRPLTEKGISRAADAFSGLDRFVPSINVIYSSQYVRALQTAEMLHGHYKKSRLKTIPQLNPEGDFRGIDSILAEHDDEDVIAFVGHQPELSLLAADLLGTNDELLIRFKKGGVALLSYMENRGQLQWLLTQRQLAFMSRL